MINFNNLQALFPEFAHCSRDDFFYALTDVVQSWNHRLTKDAVLKSVANFGKPSSHLGVDLERESSEARDCAAKPALLSTQRRSREANNEARAAPIKVKCMP